MEYNIKIIISDITVDKEYWNIAFELYVNGELKTFGGCSDDHDWGEDYAELEKLIKENPLSYVMEYLDGTW